MSARLDIETYFLEMRSRPARPSRVPPRAGVKVVHAISPTASFYRYLYDTVGAPWLWFERSHLADHALAALVGAPGIEVHVLWVEGVPAGYVELDATHPEQTQILYFGLVPEFIGCGLGQFFLDWSVDHAFARPLRRLWVHTCTLDHPRALATYQRAGFRLYDTQRGTITDPRS